MGNKRVTTRALTIVAVYPDKNLLLVKGAVPGHKGCTIMARVSTKQPDFL
jgi:large subunit ribosomal protein L3